MSIKAHILLLSLMICLTACTVPGEATILPPATAIPKPGESIYPPAAYPPPPLPTSTIPYPYPQPPPTTTPNMTPVNVVLPTLTPEPIIPFPTVPATPVVTPIPLAQPDLSALLPSQSGPLWIYYWDESQIWRTAANGASAELVLDVAQRLGRPLGAIPEQWRGTECCLTGPPVVISPDGSKLALNVGGESVAENGGFSYTLYIYDLTTGQLFDFGEGDSTVWALASERLLFQRQGDLWLGELASGATQLILPGTVLAGNYISELIWLNGETVAFTLNRGMQRLPEIWLMTLAQPELRHKLVAQMYDITQLRAAPGGDVIYFTSAEGSLYNSSPRRYLNVWKVSVSTGDIQPVTTGFRLYGYQYYQDTETILFSAFQVFVPPDDPPESDIWLQDLASGAIYRLTEGLDKGNVLGWNPAGRFFLLYDSTDATLWALDENGALQLLAGGRSFRNQYGDAIFAVAGLP